MQDTPLDVLFYFCFKFKFLSIKKIKTPQGEGF